jgi:signal transduction histidine kinase
LLDDVGLGGALSWYIDGFAERSGVHVELKVSGELGRLPSETETAIFRAVQQGLANIHRHSGSKAAQITMALDAETVKLEIRDQGCGIGPESVKGFNDGTHLPGVGIAGIRERVREMGGRFQIQSGDYGTTMALSLPIPLVN